MAVAELPPGVTERDGKFYRTVYRGGRDERGRYEQPEEREVLIATGSSDREISQAREEAARKGLDFFDPRVAVDPASGATVRDDRGNPVIVGWLDRGRKRIDEWPWNVGNDEFRNNRRYIDDETATAPVPAPVGRGKVTNDGV